MNTSLWLIVALAAAGLLLAAVTVLGLLLLRLRRENARQAASLQTLQQDMRALCNASVTVGERIGRVETVIKEMGQRQEELGLRQDRMALGEGDERSYAQAIKLAHKGAGVDELVEICGLTRGEAELIAMMHRLGRVS